MTAVDIDYLQTWVGRQRERTDRLDPFRANALAKALNRDLELEDGDILPPCWQWLYFVDAPSARDTGADGHPITGGFMPPSPLARRMWAAGQFQRSGDLILGEPARQRSVISAVDLKQGKSGDLLFVKLDHTTEQAGKPCLHEQQTIVYRDMPTASAPLPPGQLAEHPPHWRQPIEIDPVILFRYSALTYNGHRIHYDRDYAVGQEFYPALVVHGPLLATMLAELVYRQLPATSIADFRFRAMRPSFDCDMLFACGGRDGEQLHLWTENAEGFIGMQAEVTVR